VVAYFLKKLTTKWLNDKRGHFSTVCTVSDKKTGGKPWLLLCILWWCLLGVGLKNLSSPRKWRSKGNNEKKLDEQAWMNIFDRRQTD